MFYYLLEEILLHSKPRYYLKLLECSNNLNFRLKEYKKQFIKHYKKIKIIERFLLDEFDFTTKLYNYYKKLNNYKFKAEIIIVTYNSFYYFNTIYLIKHKFNNKNIKVIKLSWCSKFNQIHKYKSFITNVSELSSINHDKFEYIISYDINKIDNPLILEILHDKNKQKILRFPYIIDLKNKKFNRNY